MSTPRPTHFLSFRLPSTALHDMVAEIQTQLIAREPGAQGCAVEPVKSHLTLFVLSLGTEQAVAAAAKALESCASLVREGVPPPRVHLKGLSNFGQRVCFVPVAASCDLDRTRLLVAGAAKIFRDAGLLPAVQDATTDELGSLWTPHLTLLKTSKVRSGGRGRRGGGRGRGPSPRIRPATYTDLADSVDFGMHELREVQLCSMAGVGSDGFYQVVAQLGLDGRQEERQ